MAIDSAQKRKSISGVAGILPGVTPDATPDGSWRQSAGWSYAGITPDVPASGLVTAPVIRRRPVLMLAISAPAGSGRDERLDISLDPTIVSAIVGSTMPGGFSELSLGLDPRKPLFGPMPMTSVPDPQEFRAFNDVEMSLGGHLMFRGRIVAPSLVDGVINGLSALGYGFSATRDQYYSSSSSSSVTTGTILASILSDAAPLLSQATGERWTDPGVLHAREEFDTMYLSGVLDQVHREGDVQGNLVDWAVWDLPYLELGARQQPSTPDYVMDFDERVTAWNKNHADIRTGIAVQYTDFTTGTVTTTSIAESSAALARWEVSRTQVLKGGTLTQTAAEALRDTALEQLQWPELRGRITLPWDSVIYRPYGAPVSPYLIRAGEWLQVGEEESELILTCRHDITEEKTLLSLGTGSGDLGSVIAALQRDTQKRNEGLNPVTGGVA